MSEQQTVGPAASTHDWAVGVDDAHLHVIRSDPGRYAPGGVAHLVLEVLAYADDEAAALGRRGRALVTVHGDGSVSVVDDGRGTQIRRDARGQVIRKPVMATKDLRFFDTPHDIRLPDGHRRRGMSVVAALSRWLTHVNRRHDGAWAQRYEHGVPIADLLPVKTATGAVFDTGTSVRFLVDAALVPAAPFTTDQMPPLTGFPHLQIRLVGDAEPEMC